LKPKALFSNGMPAV